MSNHGVALAERPPSTITLRQGYGRQAVQEEAQFNTDAAAVVQGAEQFLRQRSLVMSVEDMLDAEATAQARVRRFAGKVALHGTVEVEAQPTSHLTLAEAINSFVATGDPEAEKLIDINVGSAVAEACFKQRHRTLTEKERNEHGEHLQFGLTTELMQYYSYVHRTNRPDELKAFTLVEALNGFREEELAKRGLLKDHVYVVASCVPNGLPEDMLAGDGFFTASMTFCLQGSTETPEGKIVMESVFDVGTAAQPEASYEAREAARFDLSALQHFYKTAGMKAPDGALAMLGKPLLVHKSLLPGGMVDMLRLVHIARDQLEGRVVDRPAASYQQIIADSKKREAGMGDARARVKAELIAAAGTFNQPIEANQLLWDMVKKHVVQEAVTNLDIDPLVFGQRAATRIQKARYYQEIGDMEQMKRWLRSAERVAQIVGCGGKSKLDKKDSDEENSVKKELGEPDENEVPSVLTCPKCHKPSAKEQVIHEDEGLWACPKCHFTVDVCSGETIDTGARQEAGAVAAVVALLERTGILRPLNEGPKQSDFSLTA